MKRILFLFTVVFFGFTTAVAQPFTKKGLDLPSGSNQLAPVRWMDMNQDGVLDIFEGQGNYTWIFAHEGQTFVELSTNLNTLYYEDGYSIWKDYDGDEDLDLLTVSSSKIYVAVNDGNLTFTLQELPIQLISTDFGPMFWEDVDGDQDLDVIVAPSIFINNNGTYTKSIYSFPIGIQKAFWADANNDGLADMLTSIGDPGYTDKVLYLYLNHGDGNFVQEGNPLSYSFGNNATAQWMDADGDQDLDIIMLNPSLYTTNCSLLKNMYTELGSVTFTQVFSFDPVYSPSVSVGDINLDGLPDVVISGSFTPTNLYLNTTSGSNISFSKTDLNIHAGTSSSIQMLDFDGDNDLDVHFRGYNTNQYFPYNQDPVDSILVNNSSVTRILPTIPTGISTSIGKNVMLAWSGATGGLYNIELKRNGQVLRSASYSGNGSLLDPANATLVRTQGLTLTGLAEGQYSWKVEAVDHAFRTSGFSVSDTFSIAPAPSNLKVTMIDFATVKLDWTGTSSATSYSIFRGSDSESIIEVAKVNSGTLTYTDAGLLPNKTYEYFVKAVSSAAAYSTASNKVEFFSGQFLEIPFAQKNPNVVYGNGVSTDLDNDNDYDLEVIGSISNFGTNVAFLNNGTGIFNDTTSLPSSTFSFPYYKVIAATDIDLDGDEDIVALLGMDYSWKTIDVFLNQGGKYVKGFESDQHIALDAQVSDLNNDGRPDLLMTYTIGNSTGNPYTYDLLLQNTDGSFSLSPIRFAPEATNIGPMELADINNDGFTDIVFLGTYYGLDSVTVFQNVAGRTFKKMPSFSKSVSSVKIFDANADGIPDFIAQFNYGSFQIRLGLGNWKFSDAVDLPGYGGKVFNVVDLDQDGLPDLIGQNYSLYWLRNLGNGQFEMAGSQFKDTSAGTATILTDIENDGDIDVVKMGGNYYQGANYIYENQIGIVNPNQAPSAPAAITTTVVADHIVFSWTPSTDDHTPQTLISYNLWVQDSNGKSWLHSETNPDGTFRRRLAPGNAGYSTTYILNDLPAGSYTVKVQALDASFKLSTWSVSSFTVEAGPTNLTIDRVLLNKVNLTWTLSSFVEQTVVVERKSINSDYQVISELPAGSTTFTDQGLEYNTTYTYRVYEKSDVTITGASDPATWNTNQWVIQTTDLPNVYGSNDVGDFNQDGKMDLLINGGRISNGYIVETAKAIFEYTDSGWVRNNITPSSLTQTATLQFFDVNGDYQLDLFQNGYTNSGNGTEVFLNNGDNTFIPSTNIFTNDSYTLQSVYDFDLDNDLDVFVVDNGVRRLLENKNNGNYVYNPAADSVCQYNCSFDVAAGDYDNDGDEDIFRYVPNKGYQLLLSTPDGFKRSTVLSGYAGNRLKPFDINNDGLLDVIMINENYYYSYQKSQLFKNTGLSPSGDVTFQLVRDDFPYSGQGEVPTMHADIDHDGDEDMIIISPKANIYTNDGTGNFSTYVLPEYNFSINSKLIDFDNDGDLDVYVSGYTYYNQTVVYDDPKARVLLNQTIVNGKGVINQAPTVPSNLVASQDSLGLHLSWDAAIDDHTPTTGLSYDIVIYFNGKPITGSSIDPVTGVRRRLEAGRHGNKAQLVNLAPGDYTWKVQAVDQSFRGSALSPEGSFTFRPKPPIINDTVIYLCGRTVTLTAKGQNIEWYSDKALTNKVASGDYHPTTSQVVYVIQNISSIKGIPRTLHITISDKPAPPVIPNPYYCDYYSTFMLEAQGNNVRWYSDESKTTLLGTGPSIYVNAKEASYYATQTIGCESDVVKVDVKPVVINADLYYLDGKIYSYEKDGQDYAWYENNWLIDEGTNPYITYDGDSATFRVRVVKDGCFGISKPFTWWPGKVTAIENSGDDLALSAYPNPARPGTEIFISVPSSGTLNIYDLKGALQFSMSFERSNNYSLRTQNWNTGMYFISFDDGKKVYHRKLILI